MTSRWHAVGGPEASGGVVRPSQDSREKTRTPERANRTPACDRVAFLGPALIPGPRTLKPSGGRKSSAGAKRPAFKHTRAQTFFLIVTFRSSC